MIAIRYFNLTVSGPPQGQGRGRVGINPGTGRAQVFTPAKTRGYAQQVQGEWLAAGRPTLPAGPYRLSVTVHQERPPSHFTSKGALSATGRRKPYPGKPDLDNVIKGLLDALVACGAIPDDRHMVSMTALKVWATENRAPCVVVEAVTYAANEMEAA